MSRRVKRRRGRRGETVEKSGEIKKEKTVRARERKRGETRSGDVEGEARKRKENHKRKIKRGMKRWNGRKNRRPITQDLGNMR